MNTRARSFTFLFGMLVISLLHSASKALSGDEYAQKAFWRLVPVQGACESESLWRRSAKKVVHTMVKIGEPEKAVVHASLAMGVGLRTLVPVDVCWDYLTAIVSRRALQGTGKFVHTVQFTTLLCASKLLLWWMSQSVARGYETDPLLIYAALCSVVGEGLSTISVCFEMFPLFNKSVGTKRQSKREIYEQKTQKGIMVVEGHVTPIASEHARSLGYVAASVVERLLAPYSISASLLSGVASLVFSGVSKLAQLGYDVFLQKWYLPVLHRAKRSAGGY